MFRSRHNIPSTHNIMPRHKCIAKFNRVIKCMFLSPSPRDNGFRRPCKIKQVYLYRYHIVPKTLTAPPPLRIIFILLFYYYCNIIHANRRIVYAFSTLYQPIFSFCSVFSFFFFVLSAGRSIRSRSSDWSSSFVFRYIL